jgi:hypothetical protein
VAQDVAPLPPDGGPGTGRHVRAGALAHRASAMELPKIFGGLVNQLAE